MTLSVTKKFCERYTVKNNGEYATILLHSWTRPSTGDAGRSGYGGDIMINSSFGNWSHSWALVVCLSRSSCSSLISMTCSPSSWVGASSELMVPRRFGLRSRKL